MYCHIKLHHIYTCHVKKHMKTISALQGVTSERIGLIHGVKVHPHNKLHHIYRFYVKTIMKMLTYWTSDGQTYVVESKAKFAQVLSHTYYAIIINKPAGQMS